MKVEEDKFSATPRPSNKENKSYLTDVDVTGREASLSANAPACVAGWDWEEPAGCVRRTAPPPACGKALGLGG